MTSAFVVPLDGSVRDPARLGGKAANLVSLVDAGFAVPAAVCVTTDAFRELSADKTSKELLDELEELDETAAERATAVGAELREHLRGRPVPDAVRDGLAAFIDENRSYAVRSSATAEDLPHASFAGQHDTFLDVRGIDALVDGVRDCMASLFTDRAVAYRVQNDISHREVANAVVVQEMVAADAAGVLFTVDPDSGNRTVAVVEASFGLGDSVVSGDVEPDSVRIDRQAGEVLSYRVGSKRTARYSTGDGDTDTVELDPTDRHARVLRTRQLTELVELGDRVEDLFGRPQDIEWALVDGEFVLLQARPITTLFPVPTPAPTDDRLHVYVGVGHMQAFPEALPPLVRDVWGVYIETMPEAFGIDDGVSLGAEAGGRVYMDLTPALRVPFVREKVVSGFDALSEPVADGLWDLLARRPEEFRTEIPSPSTAFSVAGGVWRGAEVVLPVLPATLASVADAFVGDPRPPEEFERLFLEWGRETTADIHDRPTVAARARAAANSLDVSEVIADLYPRMGPLLAAFAVGGWLRRNFPDAEEDVNAVGKGFEAELVTRLNLGLGDLADVARDHPAVADAIRERKPLAEIAAVEGGAEFVAAFEDYLDEFGHRATGEIDLSRPRWREDPATLFGAIRANLANEGAGDHRARLQRLAAEGEAAGDRLAARANYGLLGPARTRIVRRLIRTYRSYVQLREYPKHGAAHWFSTWRETYLEAGETLVERGVLSDRDDVWFLRLEELFAALDGEEIRVDVTARREEFARHSKLNAPPVLTSEGEIPRVAPDLTGLPPETLVGTGVSSGVVEGVARVIFDPTEATVEAGEILVAPSSDPGWTPLFLNAAGMVVEVGGRISHGALVAREYGLPAVVSVENATERIRTGQRLRIDGTRGTVEILGDEAGESDDVTERSSGTDDGPATGTGTGGGPVSPGGSGTTAE